MDEELVRKGETGDVPPVRSDFWQRTWAVTFRWTLRDAVIVGTALAVVVAWPYSFGYVCALLVPGVLIYSIYSTVHGLSSSSTRAMEHWSDRMRLQHQEVLTAIETADTPALRRALEDGLKPGVRGRSGKTLLMAAAEAGDLTLVKILLTRHVDVNAQDEAGNTALALAHARGHREVVRALRGAGARGELPELPDRGDLPLPAGAPAPDVETLPVVPGDPLDA